MYTLYMTIYNVICNDMYPPISQDLHITYLKICKSHYIYTLHITLQMHITCIHISQDLHITSLKSAHVYPYLKICTSHYMYTSYMTLQMHIRLYTDISRSAHVSTHFSRSAHHISQDLHIILHVHTVHDNTCARYRVAKTQPMAYKVA